MFSFRSNLRRQRAVKTSSAETPQRGLRHLATPEECAALRVALLDAEPACGTCYFAPNICSSLPACLRRVPYLGDCPGPRPRPPKGGRPAALTHNGLPNWRRRKEWRPRCRYGSSLVGRVSLYGRLVNPRQTFVRRGQGRAGSAGAVPAVSAIFWTRSGRCN